REAGITSGYAYEDWHFNCEALCAGYEFVIAKNTVFFYRQRSNSLLKKSDAISSRQIPFSNFFRPEQFTTICASDYARWKDKISAIADPATIRENFVGNGVCTELVHAANRIDPAVDFAFIERIHTFSNLEGSLDGGAAYFRICKQLCGSEFTDVVLLPFLTKG